MISVMFVICTFSYQPGEAKTDQIGVSSLKDSSISSTNTTAAADLFSIHNFEVSINMDLPTGG